MEHRQQERAMRLKEFSHRQAIRLQMQLQPLAVSQPALRRKLVEHSIEQMEIHSVEQNLPQ